MIPPNYLAVRTNNSYAPFIVSGYLSLPKKSAFLISSNSCPCLDSSFRRKKHRLEFFFLRCYFFWCISYFIHIFQTAQKFFTPAGIKFIIGEFNLYNYSSLVSSGPWRIVTNEMSFLLWTSLVFSLHVLLPLFSSGLLLATKNRNLFTSYHGQGLISSLTEDSGWTVQILSHRLFSCFL